MRIAEKSLKILSKNVTFFEVCESIYVGKILAKVKNEFSKFF